MAALSHLLLVHWNSALCHNRPDLLGTHLHTQWETFFAASVAIVNDLPTQPLQHAMRFLGYCCNRCHRYGWDTTHCFFCPSIASASASADLAAVKTAAFTAWKLLPANAGKSRDEWNKTSAAKRIRSSSSKEFSSEEMAYEALSKNQAPIQAPGSYTL
jgi:hypothetical protein